MTNDPDFHLDKHGEFMKNAHMSKEHITLYHIWNEADGPGSDRFVATLIEAQWEAAAECGIASYKIKLDPDGRFVSDGNVEAHVRRERIECTRRGLVDALNNLPKRKIT